MRLQSLFWQISFVFPVYPYHSILLGAIKPPKFSENYTNEFNINYLICKNVLKIFSPRPLIQPHVSSIFMHYLNNTSTWKKSSLRTLFLSLYATLSAMNFEKNLDTSLGYICNLKALPNRGKFLQKTYRIVRIME